MFFVFLFPEDREHKKRASEYFNYIGCFPPAPGALLLASSSSTTTYMLAPGIMMIYSAAGVIALVTTWDQLLREGSRSDNKERLFFSINVANNDFLHSRVCSAIVLQRSRRKTKIPTATTTSV